MIVVKLELWPNGNESRSQSLGIAHIANESNLSDISSYSVKLLKSAMYSSPRNVGQVWRQGQVHGWPRTSKQVGPWELLYLALESALGKQRISTARRLCDEGQKSTQIKYGIGVSRDMQEFGMTNGPFKLLTANKRFACDTKDEAIRSFIARKERQIRILNRQLYDAREDMTLGWRHLDRE